MSFTEIANSGSLYVLVIIALLLVLATILYTLKKSYRHALDCGVSKETMRALVKSSLSFAIMPSLGVVVGLISLVAVIGIPYAWLRLSVLGSVVYELMASNMALAAMDLDLASADANAFGLIMWVMCMGITLPMIFNVILTKPVHMGAMKLGAKDKKWGQVAQTTFMSALLIALVVPVFGKGIVQVLTFATSALIAVLIMKLSANPKYRWLGDFALAFSLIGAMAASVGYTAIFA